MNLSSKKVLIVGLGKSGVAAARFCASRGAQVTVTDQKPPEALADKVRELAGGARLELGGHRRASFIEADLIVISPGVVTEMDDLQAARAAGVPVIGELELASRYCAAPIIAITGTNGKSTTTALLGAMLAASGRPTFVGGNLGTPLLEAVGTKAAEAGGALVVEVSSFQLETVEKFHAHVALLLNLTEDHLDRYPNYAAYSAAKARIFERQTSVDFAIVNGEDDQEECRTLAQAGPAPILTFRAAPSSQTPSAGAWFDGENLCLKLPSGQQEKLPRAALPLAGRHNVQNALAALLGARLAGAPLAACEAALRSFNGLPHRMNFVAEIDGVFYYNDSKATNVGSVVGSLTGFERPVVLIAGGKDKGGDYGPLRAILKDVTRHIVLIGAASDIMERALGGVVPIHRAGHDMAAAVRLAAQLAQPGDAVVLSPACSSYDMFKNFEERGQVFAESVRALSAGKKS